MLGVLSLAIAAAAAAPCESLRALTLPQATVATADLVPAGPFVQPGRGGAPEGRDAPGPLAPGRGGRGLGRGSAGPPPLPAHCRVTMVLTPSADSHINVELWLPAEDWNGKFLVVGNGGFAGAIQGYGDMQTALRLGYATAGTDTGHSTATDGPGGCAR